MERDISATDFLKSLEKDGALSFEQFQRISSAHQNTGHPVDLVVRELGLMPEVRLSEALASYSNSPMLTELATSIDNVDLIDIIGRNYAEEKSIIPVRADATDLEVIVADPFASDDLDVVSYLFDRRLKVSIATRTSIQSFFRRFNESNASAEKTDAIEEDVDDVERLRDIAREAPIIRFVTRIVQTAVEQKASDIHIEPQADNIRIRFRQNGFLGVVETAQKSLMAGIVSRIKILAKLNISERRLPQDGRMRMAVRGQDIDLRVSVVPSVHGETIVLRILDRGEVRLDLGSLGYDDNATRKISEIVKKPNGIFLITGPTGSGKTTTLYSILADLNQNDVKIFTVEDPVEYRLDGVTQLQVESAIGLTFSDALRSVLRQDPDIILVGEIRDRETAQIAIQAALTGHLVLATLHTNSAIGAIVRLQDMGIESFLLSATLRGVISQRLVRTVCPECKKDLAGKCASCHGTGYTGRRVTYEILEISDEIRNLIDGAASQTDIVKQARKDGMQSLLQHAKGLVERGLTTNEEVARVIELGST